MAVAEMEQRTDGACVLGMEKGQAEFWGQRKTGYYRRPRQLEFTTEMLFRTETRDT
jgi:hypothetical protein